MEIPLSLRRLADGGLRYGIPLWYRLMTAAMAAIVLAGSFMSGGAPGVLTWVFIVLLLLGLLYEERWIVDPKASTVRHAGGIWPFVKTISIAFDEIEDFRLAAYARGTVPGSAEETAEKERAFTMMNGKDFETGAKRSIWKSGGHKPYINLMIATKAGDDYLVDTLPARRAGRFKKVGEQLAQASGRPFSSEG